MRTPASDAVDARLRDLLTLEQRLQSRVSHAREDADRRIRDAHADADRRLKEADLAMASLSAADARAGEEAQQARLAGIAAAHASAMAALARITDAEVDRLAQVVLARLHDELGGAS